jgi:xanthine dehydrogenase/oxidase
VSPRQALGRPSPECSSHGEPPLVLAASVSFAVKYAVRALRVERGLAGLFRLDAPATVRDVRRACAIPGTEMASTPA